MEYRCIEEFQVQAVDDAGFEVENKVFEVQEGSTWYLEDYRERFDEVELRQLDDSKYGWLNINKSTLDAYFEVIN